MISNHTPQQSYSERLTSQSFKMLPPYSELTLLCSHSELVLSTALEWKYAVTLRVGYRQFSSCNLTILRFFPLKSLSCSSTHASFENLHWVVFYRFSDNATGLMPSNSELTWRTEQAKDVDIMLLRNWLHSQTIIWTDWPVVTTLQRTKCKQNVKLCSAVAWMPNSATQLPFFGRFFHLHI